MTGVKPHLRYASYVVRHKWFVFLAGRKTGVSTWRLLIHDWSKMSAAEWTPYVEKFYGNWGSADGFEHADAIQARVQAAFDAAWLHHQHRNPHHWQHWMLQEDNGSLKLLPMPEHFVREMVADWMGAGRAITGRWEVAEWYAKNRDKIKLADETREHVEALLSWV